MKRDHDKGSGKYIDPFAFLPKAGGIARQMRPAAQSLMAALDEPTPAPSPALPPPRKAPTRKGKPAAKKGNASTTPRPKDKARARVRKTRAPRGTGRSILVACKVTLDTSAALDTWAKQEGMSRSGAAARLLTAALAKARAKVPRA